MIEFRIGAYTYRARPRAALVQYAVLSKLAPVAAAGLGDLVPFILELKEKGASALGGAATGAALAALGPLSKALAAMQDDHRGEVLSACLSLVERKGDMDAGWAKIWNAEARSPMFDDLNADATLMLRISFEVLKATFVPFFKGLLPGLSEQAGD